MANPGSADTTGSHTPDILASLGYEILQFAGTKNLDTVDRSMREQVGKAAAACVFMELWGTRTDYERVLSEYLRGQLPEWDSIPIRTYIKSSTARYRLEAGGTRQRGATAADKILEVLTARHARLLEDAESGDSDHGVARKLGLEAVFLATTGATAAEVAVAEDAAGAVVEREAASLEERCGALSLGEAVNCISILLRLSDLQSHTLRYYLDSADTSATFNAKERKALEGALFAVGQLFLQYAGSLPEAGRTDAAFRAEWETANRTIGITVPRSAVLHIVSQLGYEEARARRDRLTHITKEVLLFGLRRHRSSSRILDYIESLRPKYKPFPTN
jgi:hypothetical protein